MAECNHLWFPVYTWRWWKAMCLDCDERRFLERRWPWHRESMADGEARIRRLLGPGEAPRREAGETESPEAAGSAVPLSGDEDAPSPGLSLSCARCEEPITKPAGLAFSPPDENSRSIKTHLCGPCYFEFTGWVLEGRDD